MDNLIQFQFLIKKKTNLLTVFGFKFLKFVIQPPRRYFSVRPGSGLFLGPARARIYTKNHEADRVAYTIWLANPARLH